MAPIPIRCHHFPASGRSDEPGTQLSIHDFFRPISLIHSGQLYAPSPGAGVGPPPRGVAGVPPAFDSCSEFPSDTPGGNEGPLQESCSRNPRAEARRIRRQEYRRWRAQVRGVGAQGLDSLGLYVSRSGEQQPSNPAQSASREDVRRALTGQGGVLRCSELWERHRHVTPPSVTQLASRVSNKILRKRSTVVRASLFRERVLLPLPSTVSRTRAKHST